MATPVRDPLLARPPILDAQDEADDVPPCNIRATVQEAMAAPLSLAHAVEVAMCHNPQLRSAWAAIKGQAAQVGQARAAYLPTINLSMSRLRQRMQYPDALVNANTEQTSTAKYGTLTWRLLDFGGRDANRRAANATLAAALASHNAALQHMMSNVVGLYFDAETAWATHEAKEKNEALARLTLETAQKREMRGAGATSDTLQAKTALARAELDNARAQGAYDKAIVALIVGMGLPADEANWQNMTLARETEEPDQGWQQELTNWLQMARIAHPAIVSAKAQLEAARERLTIVQSEGLPTLDLTASQYVNGYPNQGLSASHSIQRIVGLQLNIPLFDGFSRTYKVREAQAQIETKAAELRDVETQVLGEVAKAYADAASALRNLESSRRLRIAAEDALTTVRKKYDRGVADITEMLSVQAALADAEQEKIRAQAEWRSAKLRLLANAGQIGPRDLTEAARE
jgi:outer membrane protein